MGSPRGRRRRRSRGLLMFRRPSRAARGAAPVGVVALVEGRGGLPDPNGMAHTLVVVICNHDQTLASADPQFLSRSLDHLTTTVGVPAIVADLSPKDLIASFERTRASAKDVFFLSPGPAN